MYTKVFGMKEQSLDLSSPPACLSLCLLPVPSSDAEQLLMCERQVASHVTLLSSCARGFLLHCEAM